MDVELIQYIGEVKNDTGVYGKAFMFNVIDTEKEYNFDCILFLHPHDNIDNFVTLHNDDIEYGKDNIKELILKKYTFEKLMEV